MYEDATVVHLATCLANLANAQAAAPYASPSFAGQDAVTRATKDVVDAAQMLVRTAATYRAREAHRSAAPTPTRALPALLRLGDATVNLDHCLYLTNHDTYTQVYMTGDRPYLIEEPYHSAVQAWLGQHVMDVGAGKTLALVPQEEE